MHKPILFALLSITTLVLLFVLNRPAWRTAELSRAGTPANAARVVHDWRTASEDGRKRLGVYLDFALVACYAPLLVWGSAWAGRVFARAGSVGPARAAQFMIGVSLSAVVIDVAENVALLKMLGGDTGEPWPRLAHVMSRWKVTVPFVPAVYAAAAFAATRRGTAPPRMLGE
jgi:hypothetical protein